MVLPVLWPQLTPGHYAFCRTRLLSASASFIASLTGPPGVSHNSFAAQPPDLLLRFYVYLSDFGLHSILIHRLALYPVSVRRLLGFATPLPPLLPLPVATYSSLHLVVNTRGATFTRKNCAMPGNRVERGLGPSLPLHRTYGSVYGATSWYGFRHYCLLLRRLLAKFNRFTCPPFQPLRVTIPSPWLSLRVRATVGLLTVTCNTTTLGPSGTASPTMASADSRSLAFYRTRLTPR